MGSCVCVCSRLLVLGLKIYAIFLGSIRRCVYCMCECVYILFYNSGRLYLKIYGICERYDPLLVWRRARDGAKPRSIGSVSVVCMWCVCVCVTALSVVYLVAEYLFLHITCSLVRCVAVGPEDKKTTGWQVCICGGETFWDCLNFECETIKRERCFSRTRKDLVRWNSTSWTKKLRLHENGG